MNWPDWSGQTAVVVASGSSAKLFDFEHVRGKARVIVVNLGFRLVPWADLLYAADYSFWLAYPDAHDFPGLKVSIDSPFSHIKSATLARERDRRLHTPIRGPVGTLGAGGNSGFQALNLAVQLGAKKVILVGFDMQGGHWHPDHGPRLRNPTPGCLETWRARLDAAAPIYASWGVTVLNASPTSALTAYPKLC